VPCRRGGECSSRTFEAARHHSEGLRTSSSTRAITRFLIASSARAKSSLGEKAGGLTRTSTPESFKPRGRRGGTVLCATFSGFPWPHLTKAAVLRKNPDVILSRVAKALCALAAILGLAGLSVLPSEHIHSHSDDATAHQASLVHRHFAPHHAGGLVGSSHLPPVRQAVHPGDDDEQPRTIQVFFTAGTRAAGRYAPSVAIQSDIELHEAPTRPVSEAFSAPPQPYISPPGIAPPLRAPPVFS
jgi:hypothetical protein